MGLHLAPPQLDEVSMMDTEAWNAIAGILSCIDNTRRPHANHEDDDPFGALHVLLFGDFKQTAERRNLCVFKWQ